VLLQITVGLILERSVLAMGLLWSMERVKDSPVTILSFVCLLGYSIHIRVSFMTNILVDLKRNKKFLLPLLLLLLLILILPLLPPVLMLLILVLPILL
jgi:hypothetical protein